MPEVDRIRLNPEEVADFIRSLRLRLSSEPGKPVSQQKFSDLLGVSWSTVARWETGGSPDSSVVRKLERLASALDLVEELVDPRYRLMFFEQRHPLLLNMRPIELLDSDNGATAVINILKGAATGSFV